MATAQIENLKEHFLTCSVCTEIFRSPSTLRCDHTFCRHCLTEYTKTRPEAVQSGVIPCPLCRQQTTVPNSKKPVDDWASQIKPTPTIQSLLDNFGSPTPVTSNENLCGYCLEKGESVTAKSWCTDCEISLCDGCVKGHRRLAVTRHHDVSDLSAEAPVGTRRRVMCKEHKTEIVKFVCKDCNKSACQECCILYHRPCKSVVTVDSMVPEFTSVLTSKKKTMMSQMKDKNTKLKARKSKIETLTRKRSQLSQEIRTTSQRAVDGIRKKEKQLLDELDDVTEKQIQELQADIKSLKMSIEMTKDQSQCIDQTLTSDDNMGKFDMYQLCQSGVLISDDIAYESVKTRSIADIRLRQNIDELSKTLDELKLGDIDVVYEGKATQFTSPVLRDTIDTSTGDISFPFDVTVLTVKGITTSVVTDGSSWSVKSFYTRNKRQCHSKLSLDGHPVGLTRLKHNQVAVAVHNSNKIVILDVTPDLVQLSAINTSKPYYCIAVLSPSSLAACSPQKHCVDIISMTGQVLRSFNSSGQLSQLSKPQYLCVTGTGNILVSDLVSKCIICMTPSGDVVFTYRGTGERALISPEGITTSSRGDILVADFHTDKVIQLTISGEFVRDVLTSQDSVEKPFGLCLDDQNILHVTMDEGYLKSYIFKDVRVP